MKFNIFKKDDLDKYKLTKSPCVKGQHKYLVKLAKQYDKYGYMSSSLGKEIEMLFEDDSYIVGIHRTGYSIVDDEYLKDVFNKGLINNMDAFQGGIHTDDNYMNIEKTVTLFHDPIILNGQLKVAHGYKGSYGSVILKIPKSYLGLADGEIKPIYYKDGISARLLPEYVYGYVSVDREGKLGEMIHNPNYTDNHIYIDSEDTLLYESKALSRSRKK